MSKNIQFDHAWHQKAVNTAPPDAPVGKHLWTALVDVGETIELGATAKGLRYMVPILGGRFYAGSVSKSLQGEVLAGGADRQLLRSDNVKELTAIYEMQLETGEILSIRNSVIVDQNRQPTRYACSVIEVTAPDGEYAWLNRRLIAGTLESVRQEHGAVIVRAWLIDN